MERPLKPENRTNFLAVMTEMAPKHVVRYAHTNIAALGSSKPVRNRHLTHG